MSGFPAMGAGGRLGPPAGAAAGGWFRHKRPRGAALAAGAALAVVAGTLAGIGSASGATATTTTNLAYHCAFSSGSQAVAAAVTASFPTAATQGAAIVVTGVKVSFTVPAAGLTGLTSPVTPVVDLSVKVAQGATFDTARWAGLAAPQTALPATGPLTVTATGTVASITPAGTGDVTFAAGTLDVTFTSGASTVFCALDSGQTGTLATISIPAPTSTTTTKPTSGTTTTAPPATTTPTTPPPFTACPLAGSKAIQLLAKVIAGTTIRKLGESVITAPGDLCIRNTSSATVGGDFHLYWTGTLTFQATTAVLLDFGFIPNNSIMTYTETENLVIDSWAHAGKPHATVEDHEEIQVTKVTVTSTNTELDIGPDCRTSTPVDIALNGVSTYQPVLGGPLEGYATIPPFTGCGVTENLSPILAGSISGPGNFIRVIQGKPCNVLVTTCKPTAPVFY